MTAPATAQPLAPPVPSAPLPGALRGALEGFAPVEPSVLERRALLRRSDTKFVVGVEALALALGSLARDHGVVLSGGERIATYATLYYDLPDLRGYDDHVRGRSPRHKVRARHYPDRGVSFLEVKSRTRAGRTEKARRPHPFGEEALSEAETAWALGITGWPGRCLLAQAWTRYRRITLVGLASDERITVDLDLRLERPPLTRSLGGLAIVEVKQPRLDLRSPAVLALRRAGARSRSVSKYTVAMGLLAPGVRRNRILPTLRDLERYDTWQSSSAPTGSSTRPTSSSWSPGSLST
jgi:hypothetical protein